LVEDSVMPSSHPLPIYPLCFHHGFLRVQIDRAIPIHVELRPKPLVGALLAAIMHGITTILIDYFLLDLLGILVRHTVDALNG
jgi:hypothetical protein